MEFVKFENKNWSYAGDKATWAAFDKDGNLVVKKAAKGTISSGYLAEITGFCAEHGIDFSSIGFGQTVKKAL